MVLAQAWHGILARMAGDYYATLGVPRAASQKEIREAFRRLARQHHPDLNPGDARAEERFKEISAAHEVLSDPGARASYDRYGDDWRNADRIEEMMRRRGGAGGPGAAGGFRFGGFGFGPGGPQDDGDGAFGGLFDGLFRRASGRSARRRGADVEQPVRVTLEEAYAGVSRTVELRREGRSVCGACGGSGQSAGSACRHCGGSGQSAAVRRLEVDIPAGIGDGARVRVRGQGAPGPGGGPPGDLFLRVRVAPHPRFERRGDDLHVDVEVPVADAALGGEARVPAIEGRTLALTIPAGTQGGRVFRLAEQGMPRDGGGRGDLHARVRLRLPDPLADDQRRLFERLRASERAAAARTAEARAGGA